MDNIYIFAEEDCRIYIQTEAGGESLGGMQGCQDAQHNGGPEGGAGHSGPVYVN